jgi:GT2 family glycosyltransferase
MEQQRVLRERYGVSAEVAATASHVATRPIHENNIGHRLLLKLGWNGGGLGANEQGIVEPIAVTVRKKGQALGREQDA